MRKFISGILVGMILAGTVSFAASYVADTATFKVFVNGEEFKSDKPVVAIEGSTYLPLKAIGEVLGVPVLWNDELKQVEIGNSAPQAGQNQYSRNNPAPINTIQKYTSTSDWFEEDNYSVSVRVMELQRGDEAIKALKNEHKYYSDPDEGYEYMNVKVAVSVDSTKGDFAVEPNQYDFSVFTSNNDECPTNYYTSLQPYLTGKLYEGGDTEGWITVMVKKDDAKPKMAYGLDYNGAGGIWFALYE